MNAPTLSIAGSNRIERITLSTISPSRPTTEAEPSDSLPMVPTNPTERKKSGRGKIALIGIISGMVLLLGLKAGREWWTVGRFSETTDDAYVGGDITAIAGRVSGLVSEVKVSDNQSVRAGDLLIKLDDRDYRAALARAEAAVAARRAALVNLDATRHLQEAIVAETKAEVAAADAGTYRAQQDQVRYKQLFDSATESIQSFQKADSDFKQAVAAGEKTRASQKAAELKLAVIDSQKLEANAALQQAIAEREIASLNLSYTEVRAPIDGTVGNRSAKPGSYATAGSQLLALVPVRGLWVDANYKESQLARIKVGSPARVRLDSLPGKSLRGHVISIAPATGAQFSVLPPENATGNFTKIVQRVAVRIVLDAAANDALRPGLSVQSEVDGRFQGKDAQ